MTSWKKQTVIVAAKDAPDVKATKDITVAIAGVTMNEIIVDDGVKNSGVWREAKMVIRSLWSLGKQIWKIESTW